MTRAKRVTGGMWVIVKENGISEQFTFLIVYVSLRPNSLGKGMNPPLLTPMNKCYIMTVDMDFGFVPGDPVCFDKLSHCN